MLTFNLLGVGKEDAQREVVCEASREEIKNDGPGKGASNQSKPRIGAPFGDSEARLKQGIWGLGKKRKSSKLLKSLKSVNTERCFSFSRNARMKLIGSRFETDKTSYNAQ